MYEEKEGIVEYLKLSKRSMLSEVSDLSRGMEEAEAKPQIPAPVQPQVDFEWPKMVKPLTTSSSATSSASIAEGSTSMIVDSSCISSWRGDRQERTSSISAVTEVSDPLSTAQGKHLGILESADTPEIFYTDDESTLGSISLGDDTDDNESKSKRRKMDSSLIEANLASRAVRERRVVVQTNSEVDILDDGYRWRKYGQKPVKGSPHPRSYYKCTRAGCPARKHVERAAHDLKCVNTTYVGKHNHEMPAASSSGHLNTAGGSVASASSNTQALGHTELERAMERELERAMEWERRRERLRERLLELER